MAVPAISMAVAAMLLSLMILPPGQAAGQAPPAPATVQSKHQAQASPAERP